MRGTWVLLILCVGLCVGNHIGVDTGLGPAEVYTRSYAGYTTAPAPYVAPHTKLCRPGWVYSQSDNMCHACPRGTYQSYEESGCSDLGNNLICPVSSFFACGGTVPLAETAWAVEVSGGLITGRCIPPPAPPGYVLPASSCASEPINTQGMSTTDLVSWSRVCTHNMTVSGAQVSLGWADGAGADACPISTVKVCDRTSQVPWEKVQWSTKGSCPSGTYEPFPGGSCKECSGAGCIVGPVCQPITTHEFSSIAHGKCDVPSSFPPTINRDQWSAECSDMGVERNISVRVWFPCASNAGSGQCVSLAGSHYFAPWYGGVSKYACANPSSDHTECQCPADKPVYRFTSTYDATTNQWAEAGCTAACGPNQFPLKLPHTNSSACAWCNYWPSGNASEPTLKYSSDAGSTTCQKVPPSECFTWMNTGTVGEGSSTNVIDGRVCCKRDQAFVPTPGVQDERSCQYCPLGQYSPPQSPKCLECAPGTINVYGWNATCNIPISANASLQTREYHGVFTPGFQYSCKYLEDYCSPCGKGRISNANHTQCIPCGRGYFQPLERSDVCQKCPPGSYSESGWSECQACPLFTAFDPVANECKPKGCGENQVVMANGSCATCAPNSYMPFPLQEIRNPKSCYICPRNTYRDANMRSCQPCRAGTAGKDPTGCVLCTGK